MAAPTLIVVPTEVSAQAPLFMYYQLLMADPAPDFTLKVLDSDQTISLSRLAGQPVLINFRASWCLPCRTVMPELQQANDANEGDGLVVLGVNVTSQGTVADARAFVKELKLTFPILLVDKGEVSDGLNRVIGLPTSAFIDRAGIERRIQAGAMTRAQMAEYVTSLMEKGQGTDVDVAVPD